MSYTDIDRPTLQPGSVVAAVLINGGAVFALLFAGSTLVEKIKNKPIETQWFENPKPVTEEARAKDQPRETKETVITRDERTEDFQKQVSENDLTGYETTTGSSNEGTLTLPVEPEVTPIIPAIPIIKAARIDPRYAGGLQPVYPPSMIRADQSGSVTVRVRIGKDGRVKEVQILNSSSAEFAEATERQALRKWRFLPATHDGQAEESWREMTVQFEMPD